MLKVSKQDLHLDLFHQDKVGKKLYEIQWGKGSDSVKTSSQDKQSNRARQGLARPCGTNSR